MGFHRGEIGVCRWSCMVGQFTDAEFDAFVENVRGHANPQTSVVFDLAHGIQPPSAVQRKLLAKTVSEIPAKDRIVAHALVTNSAIARGVLTAVNWLVRSPFPERVFEAPAAAADWCREQSPRLDVDALLAELHREVPAFDGLRW